MVYQILFYVHAAIGYLIALYAILLYWLDFKIGNIDSNSTEYQNFNLTMQKFHKFISFCALSTFLIGGYMATPFIKAGAIWIIIKFVLFIGWMGIMAALGSKAIKLRIMPEKTNESLALAQSKMNLYKHLQIIIIAVIFFLVYSKPV